MENKNLTRILSQVLLVSSALFLAACDNMGDGTTDSSASGLNNGVKSNTSIGSISNSSNAQWQTWIKSLGVQGYTVTQGSSFLFDNAQCALTIAVFNSCFANNPAAPYIIPQLPTAGTYVDPDYATPFNQIAANGEPVNMIYRLNNDAMVTLLTLPPKAAYLGAIKVMYLPPRGIIILNHTLFR